MSIYLREIVDFSKINLDDNSFKISKNFKDETLRKSLNKYGLLEMPCLIKRGDFYIPFTGHNKLEILKEVSIDSVHCNIIEDVDVDTFLNRLNLKLVRGEIGPIGKIVSLNILKNEFNMSNADVDKFALENLSIPNFIMTDYEKLLNLPYSLIEFIDYRDVSYKIIRDIIALSDSIISSLDVFLKNRIVKVNVFKKIVDVLFDLAKLSGEEAFVYMLDDEEKSDVEIYRDLFVKRYPDYTKNRNSVDKIISQLNGKKLSIEFPDFFERNMMFFKIPFSKKDNFEDLKKSFNALDSTKLKELQSYL